MISGRVEKTPNLQIISFVELPRYVPLTVIITELSSIFRKLQEVVENRVQRIIG